MFLTREDIEARESAALASYAMASRDSRGRVYADEELSLIHI